MPTTYFGFALADSMFASLPDGTGIRRFVRTPDQVRETIRQGVVPCLNPSHAATIAAMLFLAGDSNTIYSSINAFAFTGEARASSSN